MYTHSLTHTLTHSHTHSLTHSLTHSPVAQAVDLVLAEHALGHGVDGGRHSV
jgi:hypothetical protein